jgi:transcriptional regulator GlxA family with amidase domain
LLEIEPSSDVVHEVLSFIREHIAEPLSVEQLAKQAHLSPRQFARTFVAATGITPARAIERMRLEIARPLIEEGTASLESIAREAGFSSPVRMRESFLRQAGTAPRELRRAARSLKVPPGGGSAD